MLQRFLLLILCCLSSVLAASSVETVTVKKGDTLFSISQKHGLSVQQLRELNQLKDNLIRSGQVLRVRPPEKKPVPAAKKPKPKVPALPKGMEARTVYTYQSLSPKDTPQKLAQRHGITVDELRRINGFSTQKMFYWGQKILIPKRIAVPIPQEPKGSALTHRRVELLGASVDVIEIDLRHRHVLVAPIVPRQRFRTGQTVRSLTAQSGAQAVINGSYFHPQSYAPAGDIVMQGQLLSRGRLPVALSITPDNRASMSEKSQWHGMETVIASGPQILSAGKTGVFHRASFRDPAVFGQAARSAIGLKSQRDLLFVSTHAKLNVHQMAAIMQKLGAREALLLDGGSSVGLSYRGSVLLDSTRKVSYGIGVYPQYQGRRYMRSVEQ